MIKILLCFISLFLTIPVFAGQFEDAMRNNDNIFLYIYTPQCGYCKKFEPNYKKLVSAFGNKCKFVKLDGNTEYGETIAYKYKAVYVPFVLLINNKTKQTTMVPPHCLTDYSCVSQRVKSFVK